jgi:hypothetical protein
MWPEEQATFHTEYCKITAIKVFTFLFRFKMHSFGYQSKHARLRKKKSLTNGFELKVNLVYMR